MAPLRRWAPRHGLISGGGADADGVRGHAGRRGYCDRNLDQPSSSTDCCANQEWRNSKPRITSFRGLACCSWADCSSRGADTAFLAHGPLPPATDDASRPYTVETRLRPGAPEVGQSVERAGFRQLMGLYLVEIQRGDQLIAPVAPSEMLSRGRSALFCRRTGPRRRASAQLEPAWRYPKQR